MKYHFTLLTKRCQHITIIIMSNTIRLSSESVSCAFDKSSMAIVLESPGISTPLTITPAWFICNEGMESRLDGTSLLEAATRDLPVPGVSWSQQSKCKDLLLESSVGLAKEVCFSVRVTNQGEEPVTLRWRQEIMGLPFNGMLFAPSGTDFYSLSSGPLDVGYRDSEDEYGLSIPMATVFDETADIGFTFSGHIEMPLPPLRFRTSPANSMATLDRKIIKLAPGESRHVRSYMLCHAGCWRPGLAWVREKFSRFFMIPEDQVASTHGCFVTTSIGDESLCRQFVREGVKNVELHYDYPHLGKYCPDGEPWTTAVDDKWVVVKKTTDPQAPEEDAPYEQIVDYMKGVVKAVGTVDRTRRFIRELKNRGISLFYYFQATEAWEFFANTHFPEAIRRHEDGSPKLTWYDHVQMNCQPETRWGQYICEQLQRVLELFPEIDGIFMDQSALDTNDYAVCRITD